MPYVTNQNKDDIYNVHIDEKIQVKESNIRMIKIKAGFFFVVVGVVSVLLFCFSPREKCTDLTKLK